LNAHLAWHPPPLEPALSAQQSHWKRKLATGLALVLAATVLVLVFGLYSRPDFMLQMANQLWSCF
jgi:uncharacterized membrane protein YdfJ with MMPL/SSD domain